MKRIVILVCLVILLTGCTRINNDNDYKQLVMNCLKDNVVTNDVALGYKFYVPRGVKLKKKLDYNQTFVYNDNDIYLYVDIVSYFYKNDLNQNLEAKSNYYYQEFEYKNKRGYVNIVDNNNSYSVELTYNYAKIEFYADNSELNKMLSIASIILNSINYNDLIIENVLTNNLGSFSDVKYELNKPDDASSDFSQYLEEYVQEESDSTESLPDE